MIDLYTAATPNGHKISIALEELSLPYTLKVLDLAQGEQKRLPFLAINPNGRIPAIVDHGAEDFAVFESGAILIYLAEKTGRLMPTDPKGRSRVLQWLMFQMGGVGPMIGQLGFFHKFAGAAWEDKRPRDRYAGETRRILAVLDQHLQGRSWMMGDDYSIADIAIFPWVRNLVGFYAAGALVGFDDFAQVRRVLEAFVARPAVQRGLLVPGEDA